MKYRMNKFYSRVDHDADITFPIDINIQDPISSIIIGLEVTNANATMVAHPVACIKKIELVDGSDVLYSLDGYEADALDWYNSDGNFRSNWNMALTGNNISRYIGLNFGRYLWDKSFAFDPNKFTNPQLRIQLDIDAGGNSGSHNFITAWANIFDECTPDLRGFFMSKEIKQYTMADDTHNYTDLPLDYPYRALYFRPFLSGTEPNSCVQNIKLSENQDKKIPFDAGAQEILRNIQAAYPPVKEGYFFAISTSNKYIFCAPSTRVIANATQWKETPSDSQMALYDGDGGRLKTIALTTGTNAQVMIEGYVPHCVYEIPFGDKNDPEDWYDVRDLGSLKLDIKGAAAATGHIFLQQLRSY